MGVELKRRVRSTKKLDRIYNHNYVIKRTKASDFENKYLKYFFLTLNDISFFLGENDMFDEKLPQWNQMNYPQDVIDRLWSKINVPKNLDGTDNINICWIHSNAQNKDGYTHMKINNITYHTHRIVYECYNGPINKCMVVCHSCDCPNCVNPNHLWEGTHAENVADKMSKGRQAKGSVVHTAVLTEDGVYDILEGIHNNKFKSTSDILKVYPVKLCTLHFLLLGKTWTYTSDSICIKLNLNLGTLRSKIIKKHKQLNVSMVKIIKKWLNNGVSVSTIAKRTGSGLTTIYSIKAGRTWKHVN